MTVSEAAAYLGLSERYVRLLAVDGRISAKRLGARFWWLVANGGRSP